MLRSSFLFSPRAWLLTLAALATPLAFSHTASAATQIGADLDFAAPIDSVVKTGGGFGIRLGNHIHLPIVVLTPEVGFTYHTFSGTYSTAAYRGIAGLRLGIGEVIRPGAFLHLGIGHIAADGPGPDPSHTAFSYDAGGFLDFTLIPILNLGFHVAYNHLNGNTDFEPLGWATMGIHGELIF